MRTCAPFFHNLGLYDTLDYALKYNFTGHFSELVVSCEKQLQSQTSSDAEFEYGFVLFLEGQNAASREHLEIAYNQGNDLAGLVLAVSYLEDPETASASFQIFSDIADGGHPVALFFLAMQHINGRGVEMDIQKGIELLELGANRGDRASANMLGDFYTDAFNYEQYLGAYSYQADLDDQRAALVAAYLSSNKGDGYEHLELAFYYLKRAADLGSRSAQRNVAHRLRFGFGTPSDVDAAFAYLLKSAEGGDVQAQLDLAQLYREGIDPVEVDEVTAAYWSDKARYSEMDRLDRRTTKSPFW